MAAQTYFSVLRGGYGFGSDRVTATSSSTPSADFELRVAHTDAMGNIPTRQDVELALDTFKDYILGNLTNNITGFPPL